MTGRTRRRGLGDASPCFIAAENGDVRVKACLKNRSVRLTATRDGKKVGHAILDPNRGGKVIVGEIEVDERARRSRVGTTLYEAAVKVACRAGLAVSSDSFRSRFAEAFWRKQEAKGRAVCEPGRGSVYDAPTKGRSTEGLPVPGEDNYGDPAWPCERYVVRAPCAVESLSGMRARARKRRR